MTTAPRAVLDSLRIASPCTADWSQMAGDDKKRFCSDCKLHVHDLSRLTTDEALDLLRQANQGRVCVRLHRRADGRVLTRDCPVGLRRKLRALWARAAALTMAMFAAVSCTRARGTTAVPTPVQQPAPQPPRMGEVEMGDVAAPPTQPAPVPEIGLVPARDSGVEMGKVARPAPRDR